MGKLFSLKEWLTVADTARHLSIVFSEEVSEGDVLRLALDGRLRLSAYFVNHANARCGKVVGEEEVEWYENPLEFSESEILPGIFDEMKGKPILILKSLSLDGERFLNLSDKVRTIRGVWDLPMIGGERHDVEHEYQNLTGGPAVSLLSLDGAFVEGEDGSICQLQESYDENEYQSGSTAALRKIEEHINYNNIEKQALAYLVQLGVRMACL